MISNFSNLGLFLKPKKKNFIKFENSPQKKMMLVIG
jgi:hypothetical protein